MSISIEELRDVLDKAEKAAVRHSAPHVHVFDLGPTIGLDFGFHPESYGPSVPPALTLRVMSNFDSEVMRIHREDGKISAIKYWREQTDDGLLEAKAGVEGVVERLSE